MKIVIAHNTYQWPGGEDVIAAEETRLLRSHGHSVVPYQRSNDELKGISRARQLLLVKDIVRSEHSKRDIRQLLRQEKPDLVHVHNTFVMISPSIYGACREEGVPVLQTLHNFRLLCPGATFSRDGKICEECLDHSLWNGIRHACYRQSHAMTAAVALMLKSHRLWDTWNTSVNGFVVNTEFARRKFIQGGFPADKIHVKPNCVGTDPEAKTGEGRYALFVGRLSPEKGVDHLLAAWAKLQSPLPLVIIGDGPMRRTLDSEIAVRGLANVSMKGWCPRSDIWEALKDAAFLIVPSTWYEGFPMTVVEAYACGTPVIASRLGALKEIVDDQRTGLHFAPGDADDLAAKVDWAFHHRHLVATMGRAARRKYEDLYTAERIYATLVRIFEQTIASCHSN